MMARVDSIAGSGTNSSPGSGFSTSSSVAPHLRCQGRIKKAYTQGSAAPRKASGRSSRARSPSRGRNNQPDATAQVLRSAKGLGLAKVLTSRRTLARHLTRKLCSPTRSLGQYGGSSRWVRYSCRFPPLPLAVHPLWLMIVPTYPPSVRPQPVAREHRRTSENPSVF